MHIPNSEKALKGARPDLVEKPSTVSASTISSTQSEEIKTFVLSRPPLSEDILCVQCQHSCDECWEPLSDGNMKWECCACEFDKAVRHEGKDGEGEDIKRHDEKLKAALEKELFGG